ncbi:MAG: DUF2461 family protein [Acidobacteriota bacterium]|nr:DUF2461 family protein [Acidobacteriota bacterium]
MAANHPPIFTPEVFRFFRELARNNNTRWMDENRDRYRAVVIAPFRDLLDRLTPAALKLNSRFVVGGRVGENFSRINRDIRFAADKSPYRPQMYLYFSEAAGGAQLYVGISAEAVTCGFRAYRESKASPLATIGRERGQRHPEYIQELRHKLGGTFESYWYKTEKGEWTKRSGWPLTPEDWKRLQGWIVRRKVPRAAATRPAFTREVEKIFREVYPIYRFAAAPDWNFRR